jgi:cell wall-associated NlpC family hydrolase
MQGFIPIRTEDAPSSKSWARSLFLPMTLLIHLSAMAVPQETGDPIAQFLVSKGLLRPSSAASAPDEPQTHARHAAPGITPNAPAKLPQQLRDGASDMVIMAMNFLGLSYQRGGNSEESGFDCSGFTRHIFKNSLGLVLPRKADDQAQAPELDRIPRDELKPGDLVFFNTLRRTFSHVGIYVGEGRFIHSPRSGGQVRMESMHMPYWNKRFTGARRAPQVAPSSPIPIGAEDAASSRGLTR